MSDDRNMVLCIGGVGDGERVEYRGYKMVWSKAQLNSQQEHVVCSTTYRHEVMHYRDAEGQQQRHEVYLAEGLSGDNVVERLFAGYRKVNEATEEQK